MIQNLPKQGFCRFSFCLTIMIVIISGCQEKANLINESKNNKKIKQKENVNTLTPKLYTGMYSSVKSNKEFYECGTGSRYLISDNGEISDIGLIDSASQKNSQKKIYLEVEGFISTKENSKRKGIDSVLIITKFMKADTSINCMN